jgi:DNA-binding HxlR family transcriptional regulator
VTGFDPGDPVYGMVRLPGAGGTFAEYATDSRLPDGFPMVSIVPTVPSRVLGPTAPERPRRSYLRLATQFLRVTYILRGDLRGSVTDEPLEVWCAGKDWCPTTATATVLGRKRHPVIVHRLLQRGPLGFNALKEAVDGVSSKVLPDSLEHLEEHGLVEREIVSEKPFRVEYSLTERGRSLDPVIAAMREWGETHLAAPPGEDDTAN